MSSCLTKVAEALAQGWNPLKMLYHPEAREHFKRKLEKSKEQAIEQLYEENAQKPPAPKKW